MIFRGLASKTQEQPVGFWFQLALVPDWKHHVSVINQICPNVASACFSTAQHFPGVAVAVAMASGLGHVASASLGSYTSVVQLLGSSSVMLRSGKNDD